MGNLLFFSRGRIWVSTSLFFLLFLGQSCQIYDETAPISTSINVNSSIQQSFQTMNFVPSSWLSESWWEMFKDEQLSQLIEQSFESNPSLQMAVERVSLAHDCAKSAFFPMLPQVNAAFEEFFAGFTWNRRGIDSTLSLLPDQIIPSWINLLSTLINFRWRIDLWGSQRKLYQAAVDEAKMQMAEAAYAKLMLSTQIAEAYFQMQYYLDLQGLERAILETQNQLLDIEIAIYQNSLTDEETLQTQEKTILTFQQEMLNTDKNIELVMHQLRSLIGLSADDPMEFQLPVSGFGSSFPFPSEIPIGLLLRRPDVVAKIWAVQASSKRIKSAQVAFLPTIDLGSFSGYLNLSWDTLLQPRGWFSSIAPMATLPIFQGLKLQNNLNISVRRYNNAVYDYNQVLLNAAKEVVDAITTFRVSNLQLQKQEEIIVKSENLLELASLRYEVGLNSLLDVLKTNLKVLQDEVQYAAMSHLHLLATLNLIKSLGGGYSCPEIEIVQEDNLAS